MIHLTKATTAVPRWLRRGLPTAAALFLAGAGAVPAQAVPAVRADHRHADDGDWLYVTVTRGDTRASGDTRGTLLLCDPPRGHSHATQACDQLRSAGGDIRGIPRKDGLCSMIYAPVSVQAHGRWQGRSVEYSETFANACVMQARTGDVFALDA
jgi:hypothetical protein